MKQKTIFKNFGNIGIADIWSIYRYRPQKSHIGRSLCNTILSVSRIRLMGCCVEVTSCQWFEVKNEENCAFLALLVLNILLTLRLTNPPLQSEKDVLKKTPRI